MQNYARRRLAGYMGLILKNFGGSYWGRSPGAGYARGRLAGYMGLILGIIFGEEARRRREEERMSNSTLRNLTTPLQRGGE